MATESLKVKISAEINDFLSSCDKMYKMLQERKDILEAGIEAIR